MIRSALARLTPFREYVIGSMFGFALACALLVGVRPGAFAAPPDLQQSAEKDTLIEQQKKDLAEADRAKALAQQTIGYLQDELKKQRGSATSWQQATSVETANFTRTAQLYKECMESTGQSSAQRWTKP